MTGKSTTKRRRYQRPLASKLGIRTLRVSLLCLLGVSPVLAQNTIHVPADQPSIQAGINAANNGDTVLVAPGTYKENIDFRGKGITVTSGATSYAGAAATVITAAAYGSVVNLSTNEPSTAVLNGFTIQGASGPAANYPVAGILISGSSPTISNNVVQQNIACGIAVLQSASPTLQGNDIRQNRAPLTLDDPIGSCGSVAGTGLSIDGGGTVTVTGNTIEENNVIGYRTEPDESNGAGIALQGFPKKLVLINNIVRNNVGYFSNGLYSLLSDTDNTVVMIQNLFYTDSSAPANADSGVGIGGGTQSPYPTVIEVNNTIYSYQGLEGFYAAGSIIENNIFDDLRPISQGGLSCEVTGPPITIGSNDIVPLPSTDTPCPLGPNNISLDPQFIAPNSGNFQVQRTSPVIAAGDITAPLIPAVDLAGKNRTVCGTIDMGAYEVHPQPAITITSSNNPSVGGTSVTFNTQIPGNCNIPTGTVTFMDGTTALGTVTLSAGASASLTTSSLTVGNHTITVTYPGDFNFDASTSPALIQVVTGYPSSTTLTVTPNPADAFAPIQLTSVVSSPFGKPTGSVTFTANGKTLATAPINGSGGASVTISTLGAGTYSIVATYSADVNFAASSSATIVETVIGADSVTSLTASANPSTFGQPVIFKVSVRAVQGDTVPTGTVTLSDNGTPLGSASIDASGSASFTISSLGVGTHSISATYSGSGNFNPSSASFNEIVTAIATTLSLTASPNPAAVGQPVTIAATATASSSTPTGSVTFFDGSTVLGTAALNASGQASLATTSLAIGTHTLTANYPAGTSFGGSNSAAVQETILPYSFTLALSPPSITIHAGQQGKVTIQLSSVGLFAGPLTLSYSTLPQYASASLSATSIALTAGESGTAALTLNTFADTIAQNQSQGGHPLVSLGSAFAATAILLLPFNVIRRKRVRVLVGMMVSAALLQALTGCTNRYYEVNLVAPGTYQVTVTATDSNNNSSTAALTVVIVP